MTLCICNILSWGCRMNYLPNLLFWIFKLFSSFWYYKKCCNTQQCTHIFVYISDYFLSINSQKQNSWVKDYVKIESCCYVWLNCLLERWYECSTSVFFRAHSLLPMLATGQEAGQTHCGSFSVPWYGVCMLSMHQALKNIC